MNSEERIISVLHHIHRDREWYQTFEAMQIRLRDVIRHIVTMIENHQIEYFYLDGRTCVLDDYREIVSKEESSRLEELIRRGKIQVGPWYVLTDESPCPPEACVRNLETGMKTAEEYGSFCRLGYLPDTFGHIGPMPQILKEFGIDYAVVWRGTNLSNCEVWWEENDKSRLATLVLSTRDGYYQMFLKHQDYERELDAYLDFHNHKKSWNRPVLMDGANHIVRNDNVLKKLRAYENDRNVQFQKVLTNQLCERLLKCDIQEAVKGELRDASKIYVLSGTWSSRMCLKVMDQKRVNAMVHWVEFLNVWETGESRPEALLEHMWKKLLINRAHDSICGYSIDKVHSDMESRFRQILESASQYADTVLEQLYPYKYMDSSVFNEWLHMIHNTPYQGRTLVTAVILV